MPELDPLAELEAEQERKARGIVLLVRDVVDGTWVEEGELPYGCDKVHIESRMLGGDWKMNQVPATPHKPKTIRKLFEGPGPFKFDEYRMVPVAIGEYCRSCGLVHH